MYNTFLVTSIWKYINGIRIAKAEELLIGTDMPITDIAYMCGFSYSNYFARKFKQITGENPRDERKKALV